MVNNSERSRKKNDQCNPENERRRLGGSKAQGGGARANSDSTADSDSATENQLERSREDDIGGVLDDLDKLEQAYKDYVRAHETRLEQRLKENREHQSQFFVRAEQLRQRISALVKTDKD